LRAILNPRDALFLARPQSESGKQLDVYLKPLGRTVSIRSGGSDLACLDQVFRQHEYASPYSIEPRIIIDAGANIGAASLYFAQRYPQARIIAVEPDPSNYDLLVKNCAAYSNVTTVQAALWFENTTVNFLEPDAEKWAMAVGSSNDDCGTVKAVTVPELIKTYGLDRVDLLKIDIEGAELELFSNDPSWLDRVEYMAVELHDRFKPGCSAAFYGALAGKPFDQEIVGENVFVRLNRP
jgi:FkbM family methyltransferase